MERENGVEDTITVIYGGGGLSLTYFREVTGIINKLPTCDATFDSGTCSEWLRGAFIIITLAGSISAV